MSPIRLSRCLRVPALSLATALLAAGCMVGPNYHRPDTPLPQAYPEALPAQLTAAAPAPVPSDWWTLFGDPTLNELERAALADNTDIREAIARIEEANANLRAAGAAFLPEVDVQAGAARTAVPAATAIGGNTVGNGLRIGLASTFELDFWGRLRRGVESARATAQSVRAAADVVALTTAGVVAQTYIAVRSLDAQIATLEATLGAREESLRLARRRAEAGVTSDLDLNLSEGARADAAAQLKEVVRQRAIAVHALGVLTRKPDLALAADTLHRLPQPALPPPGLPSTLLVRRPDVRQAEQQLAAANARIGVARAAMLPTISLTGALGAQSSALATLLESPARTWSIGANLIGPIFDAGKYRALAEAEEARTRQVLANYQRVVERSFREVADALVTVRQTAAAEADQDVRVRAATNALRLATLRYESGYSAYLEVLDAQRTLNDAQLALLRNRQALLAADVDLMRALGGGWAGDQPLVSVEAH